MLESLDDKKKLVPEEENRDDKAWKILPLDKDKRAELLSVLHMEEKEW